MRLTRILIVGLATWLFGVLSFVLAYMLPFMENKELQANLGLIAILFPLVWNANRIYYKKSSAINGWILGTLFFLISGTMDALVTVPLLFLPEGGSYADFYGDPLFWGIGLIFVALSGAYYHLRVKNAAQPTKS
ncbi:DUF5367 family protein [Gilvibacter sediminis]|uniref:DUF5367 family protein n=1 Tax=Gilvibacter sediminis TaxID=379071 RepID=UPI0023505B84|nr:DUF5367 family protein [Gilvibacter sediminis]MDC7999381.1 hypothetical protein [Gilvibacter sediminis]